MLVAPDSLSPVQKIVVVILEPVVGDLVTP